jgi:hypothetical protein
MNLTIRTLGIIFLIPGFMTPIIVGGQVRNVDLVAENPVDAILKALDTHDIVGFGEAHISENEHQVIQALLSDPRFPMKVNDLIVEFGNSHYQSVVDRYVAGEPVSENELRATWRNALFFMVWDRPIYEQVFQKIREINQKLTPDHRVRILLVEPPFEWSTVTSATEFNRLDLQRDQYYADRIEREVLSRGRKAVAIFGTLHFLRTPYWSGAAVARDPNKAAMISAREIRLGQLLETRHPGALYFIWGNCLSMQDRNAERALTSLPIPSLVSLKDTRLGQTDFRRFLRFEANDPDPSSWKTQQFDSVADACIYLGPGSMQRMSQQALFSYQDNLWVEEMISRSKRLGELGRLYLHEIDAARAKYSRTEKPHPQ